MRNSIQKSLALFLVITCLTSILAGCSYLKNPLSSQNMSPTTETNLPNDSSSKPNVSEELSVEDVRKYIGSYETADDDACFEILGVSDTGEIFFQASWYRANGFGGVAKLKDNQAEFSVSRSDSVANGHFSFDNNTISLTLSETNIYCLEKGEYSFLAQGEIYKETTWCGRGELNHDAFLLYLSDYLNYDGEWEYCGQSGDIFQKPDDEYTDVFDLYLLKNNSNYTYYNVTFAADNKSYEIYSIGSDGKLELVCLIEPHASHNIPAISSTSTLLDTDWDILKIRIGNELGQPGFNGAAAGALYLHNIDYLDCYLPSTYPVSELYGVQNNEVKFYGIYGASSTSYVRDFVPDEALVVTPATYPINGGRLTAYVWELGNGFLVVYGVTIGSINWYDQPAYGYIHVKDLEYLSFIQ